MAKISTYVLYRSTRHARYRRLSRRTDGAKYRLLQDYRHVYRGNRDRFIGVKIMWKFPAAGWNAGYRAVLHRLDRLAHNAMVLALLPFIAKAGSFKDLSRPIV